MLFNKQLWENYWDGVLDYKKWTETDRKKWHNISKKIIPKAWIQLTYLASDNIYFVKTQDSFTFTPREDFKTNLISSFIVAGDLTGIKPHIEFSLYQKDIKNSKNKVENILIPCFKYVEDEFNEDKNHFKPLCEIPNFIKDSSHDFGFEIEDRFGEFKNDFGEDDHFSDKEYKKNGVTVRFV